MVWGISSRWEVLSVKRELVEHGQNEWIVRLGNVPYLLYCD